MTIIIVDDHGDWRDTIAEYIQELGLGEAILTAGSLSELDQLLLAVTPGILVLDAMLPDGDGLSRVSHLRTTYPAMGIIMLTGRLLSEDKVSGLSLGADHYLTKPVNLAELGATLVSLSRRLRVVPSPDPRAPRRVALRSGASPAAVADAGQRRHHRHRKPPARRADPGAPLPLTRGRLVEALGASAEAYDTHRLDAHMHRLRRGCARWPAATWAYARSTASATSAPRPCRSWAASRLRPEPATPATPRCIPPRPPPPLRALHARRQRPRARQGSRPGCRRADPGPGGRGRARRQPTGARASGRRLGAGGYGRRECVARINALDTPWGLDDARALAAAGADAVLLPRSKARPSWTLARVLDAAGAPADLPLWAMCETPLGFLRLDAIAGHPRLAALVVGTSDLVKDLHARTHARPRGNAAGAFAGRHGRPRPRTGGVGWRAPDLDDEAGLALACEQRPQPGLRRQDADSSAPDRRRQRGLCAQPREIAVARKRLQAWRDAQASGQGVAVVDGSLVENLHAREAERVLALAAAIAAA